jgi:hypothetical protein
MSYTAITNTIYAKLQEVTAFSTVYNYEPKESDAYPYASISPRNATDEVFDTASNRISYQILVRIIDFNKESATMEASVRSLVDSVMTKLRANQTLDWNCHFMKVEVQWGYSQEEIPARVADVIITCDTLI